MYRRFFILRLVTGAEFLSTNLFHGYYCWLSVFACQLAETYLVFGEVSFMNERGGRVDGIQAGHNLCFCFLFVRVVCVHVCV